MSEAVVRLFVYGTLRVGRSNYSRIARCAVDVEPATIQGVLMDLGAFPALVPGTGIVEGDLLTVKIEALRLADRIEGVAHSFYVRREVEARLESGAVLRAYAYFFGNSFKIANYPRLEIDRREGVSIYAWRRNLGPWAPKFTGAEYSFFERVSEAARRHDLTALGRMINKGPTPRLKGHAIMVYAFHHSRRRGNRKVAMRLLRMAISLWIDEWPFVMCVPLLKDGLEANLAGFLLGGDA